jgi:protein-S-isoprenylcysteine O-methyltransferase Ste14
MVDSNQSLRERGEVRQVLSGPSPKTRPRREGDSVRLTDAPSWRTEASRMAVTAGEFRYRFWIISGLFIAAFLAYSVDPVNSAVWLARSLHTAILPTVETQTLLHGVLGIGTLLVLLCAIVRTWASAYLLSSVVHDTELHTDGVVADGPYRYLRNPLYLGVFLLALGIGLGASRLGWTILVVGVVVFILRLITDEERQLSASQGATYAAYRAAVPRLFPSLRPRVTKGGRPPAWRQAVIGELFMWLISLVFLGFAITLDTRVLGWGSLAAFVPRLALERAQHLRSHPTARSGDS